MQGSDNHFPKVILEERLDDGSDTGNPAADHRALFLGEDGTLRLRDSSGTVTDVAAAAGYTPGGTDVAVADGGTGASSASAARTNLGLVIGTNVAAQSHAAQHEAGGSDEIDATGLVGAGGGGGGSGYPLDGYTLDATYGDHFDGAALSGIWTRRNFVSGAETHQYGPAATHLRIATTGRAAGDGYFQTAPGGDWTFAMKAIMRTYGAAYSISNLAPCVVDSAGTGVMIQFYNSPIALLAAALTTYAYGGSFTQTPTWIANDLPHAVQLPTWTYIRKSGTNYYGAYSFDGEVWSPETPAKAWAGTVDRVGMIAPLGFSAHANHVIDVDWFNKIA